MIIRISIAHFDPANADTVQRILTESETTLRAPIEALPGNIDYYAGIDRNAGVMTNTSVWETLEHAQAMATMKEMADLREPFETAGVPFTPITNHRTLWKI